MARFGRRRFIACAGTLLVPPVSLAVVPQLAIAQRVFRVGILNPGIMSRDERLVLWRVMLERLRALGYEEGRNLLVTYHWGSGNPKDNPEVARDMVASNPDIIVAIGTPAVRAAMAATQSIPIVFPTAGDPVGSGLVKSLARPGGNVTGQSIIQTDTAGKRIEYLLKVAPNAKRVAYLGPAANRAVAAVYRSLQKVATAKGLELRHVDARDVPSIENAFARFSAEPVDALVLSAILVGHGHLLAKLAAQHRLPAIYVFMENLDAGGLMAFGPDLRVAYSRLGDLVHRILQGASPADTPVEQMQFFLGMNLSAARAIGVTVTPELLLRADRIIE